MRHWVSTAVRTAAESTRILEVWMVQQVEEVTIESERHPFIDFEGLADTKINVREHRARNRTTGKVRITPVAPMCIDVNVERWIQAGRCRHKRGRGHRSLTEVLIHGFTTRIKHLFPNDRALDTTRTDEIWPVYTGAVSVGIARAVKHSYWSPSIPRDDRVHRPPSDPAIPVEEGQVIAGRDDDPVT